MFNNVKRFLQQVKAEYDNGNWVEAERLCKELWSKPDEMEKISLYVGVAHSFTSLYLIPGKNEGLILGVIPEKLAQIFNLQGNSVTDELPIDLMQKPIDRILQEIINSIPPISLYKIEHAMEENKILDQFLEELYLKERWEELKDGKITELVNSICKSLRFEIKKQIKKENNLKIYMGNVSFLGRISEEIPFIVVNTLGLDDGSITEVYNNIDNILYNLNLKEYLAFILVMGNSCKFKELSKKSIFDLIILDEDEVNRLIVGKDVQNNLKKLVGIISSQRGISVLSPYQTEAPARGQMFYGREQELKPLTRRTGECFAIISSRRLGKTSLLLAIYDHLRKETSYRPFFIDCSTHIDKEDFMRDVVERLEAKELLKINIQTFPNFLKRICTARHDNKVVFLLDEIDSLIAHDRKHDWEILKLWRSLFQGGYCRFIISGFRELFREKMDFNSELFRFMEPITLSGLDGESAKRLIVEPMSKLGIVFREDEGIVKEIMEETSNHPYLIQCYGDRLIHLLDEEKRRKMEITLEDVKKTSQASEIKESILKGFLSGTDAYEKIIIYAWIKDGWKGDTDIPQKFREMGINLPWNINEKLKNLELANIIYKEGNEYKVTSSSFYNILKERYDLESLIKDELRKVR